MSPSPMPEAHAEETMRILTEARAILANDHFVYISGDHGSGWVDKDIIYPHIDRVERLGQLLAQAIGNLDVDIVCGPATGGLIVAQWTARELGKLAVFAEHDQPTTTKGLRGHFILGRGYDRLVAGKKVLVVDDIVNTGLSIRQTIEAVRDKGGNVVAAAALVNRGNVEAAGLEVDRFIYLLEVKIPAWPAERCSLCRDGVPVNTEHAHGQDFLAYQGHQSC